MYPFGSAVPYENTLVLSWESINAKIVFISTKGVIGSVGSDSYRKGTQLPFSFFIFPLKKTFFGCRNFKAFFSLDCNAFT